MSKKKQVNRRTDDHAAKSPKIFQNCYNERKSVKTLTLKSLFVSGFHIKRSFANDISFTGEVAFKIVESSGLKLVDALAFFAINS